MCWLIPIDFCVSPGWLAGHLGPTTPVKKCTSVPFTSLGVCVVLGLDDVLGMDDTWVCFLHPFPLHPSAIAGKPSFHFLSDTLEWLMSALSKPAFRTCHNQPECCNCTQWGSSKWSKGIPLPSPAGLQPSCSDKAVGKNIAIMRDKAGLSKLMILLY